MDATPQVIIEAAYYGCPTIAPSSFAIPELIEDGRTGYLVQAPPDPEELADRMVRMRNPVSAAGMRVAVRERALERFRWENVAQTMATEALGAVLQRQDAAAVAGARGRSL
jgi:glycosyltransferase involved in cell wall biosynthesis